MISVDEIQWVTKEVSLANSRTRQEALKEIENVQQNTVEKRQLIRLRLTNFEHLGKDFQTSVENQEIVHYLLENVRQETSIKGSIWTIELTYEQENDKIKIEASKELAEQLFTSYEDTEEFQQILSEIYGHPIAHRLLSETHAFHQEVLQKGQQLIHSEFTIGGTEE